MKHNATQVMTWLGLSEGGYVNHKDDPGGPTNHGVTQRTFDAWRKSRDQATQDVKKLTKTEAQEILKSEYLDAVRFDDLPDGLDYAVADYSVNSGPGKAIKDLQRVIGVRPDGIFGRQTLQRIAEIQAENDIPRVIVELCETRMKFLRSLKNWTSFKNGWTTRVMGQHDGVQENDIGVIDRAVKLAKGERASMIPPPKPQNVPKALEPELPAGGTSDPVSVGTLVSGGGVVTAAGGVFSALGGLHPVAQGIAIVGLLVSLAAAAYVLRHRLRKLAAGLG